MTLHELPIGQDARVTAVSGERSFRRRLLELGLTPGTTVRLLRIAPLGDPLELAARGSRLSIRIQEARLVSVDLLPTPNAKKRPEE